MINLKNKKVLITGATGGIGGSIAKKVFVTQCRSFRNWNQFIKT